MRFLIRRRRDLMRPGKYFFILPSILMFTACAIYYNNQALKQRDLYLGHDLGFFERQTSALKQKIEVALEAETDPPSLKTVTIRHPIDEAMLPIDMAAPDIIWEKEDTDTQLWLVKIDFTAHTHGIRVLSRTNRWQPDRKLWDIMKSYAQTETIRLTVLGLSGKAPHVVSRGVVQFRVSKDSVDAPLLYQQIPLPFVRARKQTKTFRWRLGDIASYERPRTVMQNMPKCAFCHHVSRNGSTLGLDMDFKGDKGGYLLLDIQDKRDAGPADMISWNDLQVEPELPNMGLFAKISPNGRYVAATVGDKPFMAILNHLDFSQLFFPISGRLAIYDRHQGRYWLLPGADNPNYIQTSPAWSADGQTLYFARAPINRRLHEVIGKKRLLDVPPETDIHTLNARYPIQFDIYRIPFHSGHGGKATPVAGASNNKKSNFFPKISPDGRWIVFTQSETGLVAQPSSRLMIVPSTGGESRKMRCNTPLFNSWHSWSPNGRWIAFTSKMNTPYSELFLAHVDIHGQDSPPVLLSRFNDPKLAAVIPEFVNRSIADIDSITFREDK